MKITPIFLCFSLFLTITFTSLALKPPPTKVHPPSLKNCKKVIEDMYKDKSGFNISIEESQKINDEGGASTYGEITYEGLEALLKDLNLKKNDVFYDLGCGIGKVCVQAVLTTPLKKAVGIELSTTRVNHAQNIKQQMQKDKMIKRGQQLEFLEQNIVHANLDDATVIFTCSTCFSDDLMKQLTEKFIKLKPGLRVATLRELADNSDLTLTGKYDLRMSWSNSSPVYLYELKKKSNTNPSSKIKH